MDPLTRQLLELLPAYGPWLLFVLAILETSFVTGLVVPSGVATSVATVLALQGRLELVPVVAAAIAGGAIGDSLGFWIGRGLGPRFLAGESKLARLAATRHAEASRFFGRHPAYSVTVARLISFVRTLMPMAAGMSGLSYRRYVPFELLGLIGWAILYVSIGALAGESWEAATRLVGIGGAIAFALAGLVLWIVWRRRRARRVPDPVEP